MLRAGILVFSRMSSSRLPGKALMHLGGLPLVERVMRRAETTGLPVALATSDAKEDDKLSDFAESIGFDVYRGSLDNVLQRAALAAEHLQWDAFFRLCGDRPFFDIEEIQTISGNYLSGKKHVDFDLVSTWSAQTPKGLTTELINSRQLKKISDRKDLSEAEKEHLTSHFYANEATYIIHRLRSRNAMYHNACFAVDTAYDYDLFRSVCEQQNDIDISPDAVASIINQLQNV